MPVNSGQLGSGTYTWVNLVVDTVGAQGRLEPRLCLGVELRTPTERIEAILHDVTVQVRHQNEVVGEGRLVGEQAAWAGCRAQVEVPVSHRMLAWVTDQFGAEGQIGFMLRWRGLLRVRWQPNERDMRALAAPEPGVWEFVPVQFNETPLTVARSDWYRSVLQPVSGDTYLPVEIAIPRGPAAAAWTKAFSLVTAAEQCYANGDDAGVFSKLKAAWEAMPGAPKGIFGALPEPKRTAVNAMVDSYVSRYLNHGRHVAKVGPAAGEFPVDRIDSRYAIDSTKLLLSYASKAVGAQT
jgi:hypothetical protein